MLHQSAGSMQLSDNARLNKAWREMGPVRKEHAQKGAQKTSKNHWFVQPFLWLTAPHIGESIMTWRVTAQRRQLPKPCVFFATCHSKPSPV